MLINNIRKSPTCPIRNTIHAPTRGATTGQYGYANWKNDFNPRSYKRSDGKNAQLSLYLSVIIIA